MIQYAAGCISCYCNSGVVITKEHQPTESINLLYSINNKMT